MFKSKTIDLVQGSDEWKQFRSGKIGASDIPSICEVKGAYKSKIKLLDEKITNKTEEVSGYLKHLFQEGHSWEDKVRSDLNAKGLLFQPKVFQLEERPEFFASLDGIFNEEILEVKSTRSVSRIEQIQKGIVPEDYLYQMQWQMMCSNAKQALLVVVHVVTESQGETYMMTVKRDDALIDKIVQSADAFYKQMTTGIRPVQDLQNETMKYIAQSKAVVDEYKKLIKQEEDKIKEMGEKLLTEFNAVKIEGSGVRISWQERKGSIDYDSIPQLEGVDLEKFRKPSTRFVKLTEIKETT